MVTSTKRRMPDRRTYVLDTSVLLADPNAMSRFDEHEVVLPIVVVTELEAKRHHPELGYFARQALRLLDDFRVRYGRLDAPIPLGDLGGTLRVELNHSDPGVLPAGYRLGDNDSRILAVARNLQAEGYDVTVVSKDLPLRIKASSVGLLAEEYRAELAITDAGWTGMGELSLSAEQVDLLFSEETLYVPEAADLPVHTGLVLQSERGKALGRVTPEGNVRLVRGDRGLRHPRPQRRTAHRAGSAAGPGRRHRLARRPGRHRQVRTGALRRSGGRAGAGQHKKVMVFRPLYAVGGQDLGYLPGSEAEKMGPWAQAVFDTLSAVAGREVIEEVLGRGMLEVLPLTHIRGRSLHDAFVIVDEAQSLERNVLLTVLSRIGANSRVVLTHDVAQRDNLRVGRYDGVVAVVEKLKGHPLFAHTTLTRSERSPIAALVTEMLEEGQI